MPFTPGWNPDRQARVARDAQTQELVHGPLPLLSSGGAPTVVEFDWTNPSFSVRDQVARAAVLSQNASQVHGFIAATFPATTASLPIGAQSTDLPPRAVARSRDYSIGVAFPIELLGQDAVNPGAQSVELPPRAAARARDYSVTAAFPLELIGQDAMTVGRQSTDTLPPRAPLRARDYSITVAFPPELIGQDNLPPGRQLTGPAPAGPLRASTLSETGVNLTVELTAAPPVFPCGQSTASSDLPPRAAARARDYSIAASFPLELIGQDQLFGAAGQTRAFDWPLPVRGALRSFAVYDPGQNETLYLLQGGAAVLPVGQQSAELPQRGPARAREYGQATSGTGYIGQDRIYGAPGEAPSYDWPNPRAAQRARDYTWLQSLPLYVYQQLPPGQSTGASELPSRGPRRLPDYTFTASVRLQLIGQDVMYGRPGEVPTYDWQLPTPRAPRMRDYSWMQTFARGTGVQPRDLAYTVGLPQSRWTTGPVQGRWVVGTVAPG